MTTYNTGSDIANTAVRAFLTKVGEYYLGRSFNTSSGRGKEDWERIKNETFENQCAYCGCKGSEKKLTIEHLIMFNRNECGLHHPGNIVPCCASCNKREKEDNNYLNWEDHLSYIYQMNGNEIAELTKKKKFIHKHIENENYPKLTEDEKNALKTIASHLYDSSKSELDKALALYQNIDSTLVNKQNEN